MLILGEVERIIGFIDCQESKCIYQASAVIHNELYKLSSLS
jgi:hypothetical protein